MSRLPDIAIIGPGRVGTSVALLARNRGYSIAAVAGRDKARAEAAARTIGGGVRICTPVQAAMSAELVLLTVADNAIESVCTALAKGKAFSSDHIVAHLSGAYGSEILSSAADLCGAKIASVHPLQTFSTIQAAIRAMPGTYWFCEGQQEALTVLEELIEKIGGIPKRIGADKKALYHCASVIACNYLTSLIDLSLDVAQQAGIERDLAWKAFGPLVHTTINNIDKEGTANALTGPIARGDVQTVNRHLQALAECDPDILEIYRWLAKWTIQLAKRDGKLGDSAETLLLDALSSRNRFFAGNKDSY